jgi:hypothetical protein
MDQLKGRRWRMSLRPAHSWATGTITQTAINNCCCRLGRVMLAPANLQDHWLTIACINIPIRMLK